MVCKKCKAPVEDNWLVCPYCTSSLLPRKTGHKTRGNGTGQAIKRGKTWTAKVIIKYRKITNEDGSMKLLPVTRSKGGFKTKTDALAACAELKNAVLTKKAPTIAEYYRTYESGQGAKLSESKQTAYKIAYNRMEDLHDRPIDTILFAELQDLINDKCPTYYPARDVKNLLSHIYKMAAVDGFVDASLPHLLAIPKLEENDREAFTNEEQRLLWTSYEKGNKNAALPLIMIYTGMMTGEIRKLDKSMINISEKKIIGAGIKTKERKTKSILLPAAITPVLEDIMNDSDGLLYPMTETDFYAYYYKALTDAGISRKLTPYSCRHTTATRLTIDNSVAPQIVQRILRWSSTKMLDRYAHPDEKSAFDALNKLDGSVSITSEPSK